MLSRDGLKDFELEWSPSNRLKNHMNEMNIFYVSRVGPKKVNLIVATCWSRPMWEMVIECLLDTF